jgi:flagellar hook-length control protein FliK
MESRGSFDASGKSVHLKIQDQGLGSVQWHLRVEGGRVAAEAIVQSARIQELFQTNQDALQTRLGELGIEMEGFEVSVDQGSQWFSGHAQQRQVSSPAQGQEPASDTVVDPNQVERGVHAGTGGLDLYA